MKVSLTQAWEAKGLMGVSLRLAIEDRLARRFYKENPANAKAIQNTFTFMVVTAALAFVFYEFQVLAGPILPSDYTYSLDLFIVMLFLVASVAFLAAVYLALYQTMLFAAWAAKTGYVNRYVFQHREEEVEL